MSISVPSKPVIITLEPRDTSILVRWDELPARDRNGIITEYRVYYKRGSSGPVESEATVPGSARSFVIRGKDSIVHLTLKSGLQIRRSNRDN